MSKTDARGEAAPLRRLRWYDVIAPQAASLGVTFLTMLAFFFVWARQGGMALAQTHLQGLAHGFLGLNLLLDYANLILLGVSLWILGRVTDPALPARFGRPSVKIFAPGLAAGIAAVVISSLMEYLSDRFLHTSLSRDSLGMPIIPERVDQLLLGTITVAILAPLAEEVYFRGILMGWISRHGGRVWGIVLSSLVFGLLHLKFWTPGGATGVAETVELVLMGLLLGWVAWRTGSLWTSFAAHAANNFCAVLASVYLPH